MVFVFLNIAYFDDLEQSKRKPPESLNPKYLEFIKKICPPKQKVYLGHVVTKFVKKYKISRTEAETIIDHMLKEEILIKDTNQEITTNLFANVVRKAIYDHILTFPGTSISFIKSKLSLGSGQVLWHLAILEEYDLIKSKTLGKMKLFYSEDHSERMIMLGFVMLKHTVRNLLSTLMKIPQPISITDLALQTSMNIKTLRFTLKKLENLGILNSVFEIHEKKYSIFPDLLESIGEFLLKYKN